MLCMHQKSEVTRICTAAGHEELTTLEEEAQPEIKRGSDGTCFYSAVMEEILLAVFKKLEVV